MLLSFMKLFIRNVFCRLVRSSEILTSPACIYRVLSELKNQEKLEEKHLGKSTAHIGIFAVTCFGVCIFLLPLR